MSEREDWIAKRAYLIWEEAGRPHGQDDRHWQEASDDWSAAHSAFGNHGNDQPNQPDWDDENED